MLDLRACPSCRRHVAILERTCPFCAAQLEPPRAATPHRGLSRAAIFAGATLAGSACWSGQASEIEKPSDQSAQNTAVPMQADNRPTSSTATLQGIVTDSRTKQPIAGFPVTATTGTTPQRTSTDANGNYVFVRILPGDYSVMFGYDNHPRRSPVAVPLKLDAGQLRRLDQAIYIPEPSNIPMPYGAPPVRSRLV